MKKNYLFFLAFFEILLFSSCLTTKDTNLLKSPGGDIPSYSQKIEVGEYTIKPGDELFVSVNTSLDSQTATLFRLFSSQNNSQNSESSKLRTLTVSPEGVIYFPYVGNIKVQGKTTLEVEKDLENLIKEKITDECFIHVRLANRFYSVIGETSVGQYHITTEKMTIYQALAQSGNIAPYGDRSKVKVIRQISENESIIKTFDLRSADMVNSEFYYVQANDIIYIQPLKKQFWGISSFGAIFAVVSTVASFGIMIYKFVK